MKKDNQLVAYIQRKDQAPFIDIVKISKKGSSFYYAGVWWSRDDKMSMNQYCINAKGEKLKIKPLNRSYIPMILQGAKSAIKRVPRYEA